ncbi:methionine aminopeptidase 1c, putative [Plasmodium gallinaceum]|uniref:Methionine aminopeptidase 1c, putative n=1 Tax=Plasmodium gallinaceum TaxID=5849 RepID=A0A1J1GLL2_PLAGA|nr:methionine aminopeptidase 1c, putative [Plasmodium gallinaceum]CRG93101.1 methionine aminopeptidase 1c, putative [Plasmodium gallinaceum]
MKIFILLIFYFGGIYLCKKRNININFKFNERKQKNVKKYKFININKKKRVDNYNFLIIKKNYKKRIKCYGEGFSNTFHNDVKKNTNDYSEDRLPSYHRYIENFKTRKIIHPSIRLRELDKKFMKCKENYNKLFSHLNKTDIFENFSYVGRQKKGVLSPTYYLPKYIERPNYHRTGTPIYVSYDNNNNNEERSRYEYKNVKDDNDIEIISNNCKFARELMDDVSYILCEGVTTNDIDIYILNKCINNGFYPSPLNYHHYPKSCCISINEILCHGIPDNNVLFENDIVKVDISVFKNGFHADMCESFLIEKITKAEKKRRKKNYDFIYLNDKVKTKYTKYIFKYHFDLTKNMVVRKGKSITTRKMRYVAPNSKDQQNDFHFDYDDNTNSIRLNNISQNMLSNNYNDYDDELENFHKQYDDKVIYNPEKNQMYNNIQNFIYNKSEKDKKREQKHYDFFERNKFSLDDFKKFMYEKNIELIKTAYECTMEAISICKHGVPFKNIAEVIDSYIKKKRKKNIYYSVAPNLCGHNIGKNFHEEPYIFHTLNNDDRKMCENLIFTIEPIITERTSDYITWPDNWTISSSRYYFSAQFEHTILIKRNHAEILTKKNEKSPKFIWERNNI